MIPEIQKFKKGDIIKVQTKCWINIGTKAKKNYAETDVEIIGLVHKIGHVGRTSTKSAYKRIHMVALSWNQKENIRGEESSYPDSMCQLSNLKLSLNE
jgi:hypothetical protein